MLREWDRKYPGRLDNMFHALQNVVKSHLADGTIYDFRNLTITGEASEDGDKAFDEEELPAPVELPSLQVIRM
jgi:tRNA 2-thiocytidine biosynthesis protein TtcA